jgi:hypothetical protein
VSGKVLTSRHPDIIKQEQINNRLVEEVAEAIKRDLVDKGIITLNPGVVLCLRDVWYYVPRLRLSGVIDEIRSVEADPKEDINEKLKYFVIHDTGVNGESLSKYGAEKEKYKRTVHGFIDPEGAFLQTTTFSEEAYGTKMDAFKNKGVGEMIHIELLLNKEMTPTAAQYDKLAEIYKQLSGGEASLIIVTHREIDRGVTGYYKEGKWVASTGHNDPRNFGFDYFYQVLKEKFNITIIPGVSGITQERYNYDNQRDMLVNWPPVLSGKPERQ